MTIVRDLRCAELYAPSPQTLWKELWSVLRQFPTWNIVGEFHQLVHSSVYDSSVSLRKIVALFEPYRLYYHRWFRETNERDYNKADYRICGEPVNLLVFPQVLFRMLHDGLNRLSHLCQLDRILLAFGIQTTPNSAFLNRICARTSCQSSPRKDVLLLGYNLPASQAPLICRSPAVTSCAGNLNFHNYTIQAGGG